MVLTKIKLVTFMYKNHVLFTVIIYKLMLGNNNNNP